MNTRYKLNNKWIKAIWTGLCIVLLGLTGCEEDLPEAGSIRDLTPPEAGFSYAQLSSSNFLEVTFSNTSTSSTDYLWDFGDGTVSSELEPVHVYSAQGTYTVKLTASDKLGVTSITELTFTLTEPAAFIPPILESGFEDGTLDGSTGDGRDSWRNSDLGGVIQITSSPVLSGSQAAKLSGDPSDKRIGYQRLTVTANTTYELTFNYTMLDNQPGSLTVSMLDGSPVSSHAEALAATIASKTVSDQNNPDIYIKETVIFNSGSSTEVAIYFFNDGSVETRLDELSIDLTQASVPPLAGFTFAADSADYRQVNFSNTSLNATSYVWNFGDGNTSTDVSPTHLYAADGTYSVSLTARNTLGETNTTIQQVEVSQPAVNITIMEASFEDNQLAGGTGDGRDSWRKSGLGGVIQITSSPVFDGTQAAKLTGDPADQRIGFQLVTVVPNTDYDLSFYYTMKDAPNGFLTVSVLDGDVTTHAQALAQTIQSLTVTDASDPSTYIQETISFNSGGSSEIAIYFFNDGSSESRLDLFSIVQK